MLQPWWEGCPDWLGNPPLSSRCWLKPPANSDCFWAPVLRPPRLKKWLCPEASNATGNWTKTAGSTYFDFNQQIHVASVKPVQARWPWTSQISTASHKICFPIMVMKPKYNVHPDWLFSIDSLASFTGFSAKISDWMNFLFIYAEAQEFTMLWIGKLCVRRPLHFIWIRFKNVSKWLIGSHVLPSRLQSLLCEVVEFKEPLTNIGL